MKPRIPRDGASFDRRRFLGAAGSTAAVGAFGGVSLGANVAAAGAISAGEHQLSPPIIEHPPAAGAWIELNRAAIRANVAAIRRAAGGRPIMGVVKANGYGHGLVPMAWQLARAGVEALMVITVDEALALREAAIRLPVLNYGPVDADAADALIRHDVDQAVYTADGARRMAVAARRRGKTARVQVILDTGLGRVGVPVRQAADFFDELAVIAGAGDLQITGTATALTEDPDYDRVQLERYTELCERARRAGLSVGTRHVASSAAVLDFADAHLHMVRPGIMLYGHYPNDRTMQERPIELVPVLSLKARVAYVKSLQPGDSIGYHRAWTAERETTVATLPIGHSEGYPAGALRNAGAVEIEGRACPLVGGITSNHLEVAIPGDVRVQVGDVATLIAGGAPELAGPGEPPADVGAMMWSPTAQQVGRWDGSGVYGTLMHLSPLLPRLIT